MDMQNLREKFFPFTTSSGYTIRPSTKEEVYKLFDNHSPEVFPRHGEQARYKSPKEKSEPLRQLLQRYETLHHEWLVFLDSAGEPVGWHMGETEDHYTFYMRNTGILPRNQRKGLYTEFTRRLVEYLSAAGYERISSHHSPTNRKILILKLKQGFDVSGVELLENWGPMVKLVKFLSVERRESYYRQYGLLQHISD